MTLRKINKCVIPLLGAIVLFACKEDEGLLSQEATLSIDPVEVNIPATGGEQTITVTTNQQEWQASLPESDDWCTLTQAGSQLKVSANANTDINIRSTTVTISAGSGEQAKTVELNVTQLGSEPYLSINPSDPISFPHEGADATVEVVTNYTDWSVSVTDDWCTATKNGNQLTLTASASDDMRATTVTVSAGVGESLLTASIIVNQAGLPLYKITIPTDFTNGNVQKVLVSGQKIAEICNEYIRIAGQSVDERMTVVYPVVDGKADLTKGFSVKDGGTITWDLETNTCAYTPGSETTPLQDIYMKNGVFTTTGSDNPESTSVSPDLLTDTRGTKSEVYKIVKIGTQYWMAENLRAENYRDGTPIPNITDNTAWNSDESGAYRYLYNSPTDNKTLFGVLYNGYAMQNVAELSPEGWIVPSDTEWSKLRSYIGTPYGRKLASTQYWSAGTLTPTNITGFTVTPGGYFSTATGYTGDSKETYLWSTTLEYDLITKKNIPVCYRIVYTSTGMIKSSHNYQFGHSIRCVRK